MQNPNDPTAAYYENANQYLKNSQVLDEEIALIESLCDKSSKILDIGCGTGRHLLPLLKEGYKIEGIDSSSGMLNEIKKQAPVAMIHCADFLHTDLGNTDFDLCLMFWNTFNEIALTDESALALLNKCQSLLKQEGKVIINIDDSSNIDPENLDFSFQIDQPLNFKYDWKVIDFDKDTNKTVSRESIILPSKTISTEITQRWWSKEQIQNFAAETGFSFDIRHIRSNAELYIILTKLGK